MAKDKPNRNPEDWARKAIAINVRGAEEWKAWVERLAAFDRAPVSDTVDRALSMYARSIGFVEVPPKR